MYKSFKQFKVMVAKKTAKVSKRKQISKVKKAKATHPSLKARSKANKPYTGIIFKK